MIDFAVATVEWCAVLGLFWLLWAIYERVKRNG